MIDYVLVVAVGIAAGVGTLVSVFPFLQKYTLVICMIILLIITVINLRGTGDSGAIFMIPAYLFIISLFIVLGIGIFRVLSSGGNPEPLVHPPDPRNAATAMTLWIWLRTFSTGSTAITGVEAVSNGVPEFREPVVKNARITQSVIMGILLLMLLLIAWMCNAYKIGATEPGTDQYRSVLYMLVLAVVGDGWFSYIPMLSILLTAGPHNPNACGKKMVSQVSAQPERPDADGASFRQRQLQDSHYSCAVVPHRRAAC